MIIMIIIKQKINNYNDKDNDDNINNIYEVLNINVSKSCNIVTHKIAELPLQGALTLVEFPPTWEPIKVTWVESGKCR